ncbi:MAG: GNAT family N-acetyltransferase [Candidatus Hydrogenedentes bacterium]|nr:GNAT family N-acetyltransferase [Candidatus Hydrogenedentota bacterium]
MGLVAGPDLEWAGRIEKLLGHKGDPWNWQNSELLRESVGIEAYFYILHHDGIPFANIMTAELNGVGIFGHVWTNPEDRRKGAVSRLMERQMEHFRARGGKALFLGTGFDSPPYHIYRSFGFEGTENQSGLMEYYASSKAEFERDYFDGSPTVTKPLDWTHWPSSPALFMGAFPGVVRCAPLRLIGRSSTEGRLLPVLREMRSPREPSALPRAMALQNTKTSAVMGLAAWDWDPLWPDTCVVDVYCHPSSWNCAAELLEGLALPKARRYIAYDDQACGAKIEVLRSNGFRPVATMGAWAPMNRAGTGIVDVTLYERILSA